MIIIFWKTLSGYLADFFIERNMSSSHIKAVICKTIFKTVKMSARRWIIISKRTKTVISTLFTFSLKKYIYFSTQWIDYCIILYIIISLIVHIKFWSSQDLLYWNWWKHIHLLNYNYQLLSHLEHTTSCLLWRANVFCKACRIPVSCFIFTIYLLNKLNNNISKKKKVSIKSLNFPIFYFKI